MEIFVLIGVILTGLGLAGLLYCIWKAAQAKSQGITGEDLTQKLKGLVAINMAAFFLSAIGLVCVILGVLL